ILNKKRAKSPLQFKYLYMKQLVFLLLISISCFSQTHKAVYSFKVEANPLNGDMTTADEINPLAEDNSLYLYFDSVQSYFTSYNIENNQKDMSDAFAGSYYPLKYFYQKNTFQRNVEMDGLKSYTYTNNVVWEITDESKNIDRKSTRLNSSHVKISYAVFCLKQKTK